MEQVKKVNISLKDKISLGQYGILENQSLSRDPRTSGSTKINPSINTGDDLKNSVNSSRESIV